MKKLMTSLLIMVIAFVGVPLLFVGLMHEGEAFDAVPKELYQTDETAREMIYQELNEAITLAKSDMNEDLALMISEDIINVAIFNAVRGNEDRQGINEHYLPNDDCSDSSCLYVLEETMDNGAVVRVLGIWVEVSEDTLTLNVAIEVETDNFTFKTIIQTDLIIKDDVQNQTYTFEFSTLRIGRIPLPKALLTTIINLLENVTDMTLDALPFGDLELSELRYTINKQDVIDFVKSKGEDDATMLLATEVLGIIFDNGLIQLNLNDQHIELRFKISTIRNSPDKEIPSYLQDFDYENYDIEQTLKDRFDEFVFTAALTNQTYFSISESTFNRMFYKQMEGFENARFDFEYTDDLGNVQTITVGLMAVWFEFVVVEEDLEQVTYLDIYGLFDIDGIKSQLHIRSDEIIDYQTGVYAFDLSTITLGEETGKEFLTIDNLAPFKEYLSTMEDFNFGYFSEEGYIVIDTNRLTSLMEDGTNTGVVSVNEVEIVDGAIRIHIVATDANLQDVLDDFTNALQNTFEDPDLATNLETVLDITTPGPEQDTYNQVLNIQDKIDNEETITEEDVATLFENFDEMSTEAQSAFIETFEDLIDPNLLDDYTSNFE
ncbi:MAG: hypothetical protein ACLFRI_00640 [Candidatus Izemoplasmataceae bacterium]